VLSAPRREPANVLHAARQLVAQKLEPFQAEHARTTRERVRGGRAAGPRWRASESSSSWRDMRKPLGDDLRKLALELCYLGSQRVSRGVLAEEIVADRPTRRGPVAAIDGQLSGLAHVDSS
jgi:hypothetical protein